MSTYILAKDKITIYLNSEIHTASRGTHVNFDQIVEAVKEGDWDAIPNLINIKKAIQAYSKGIVTIRDGVLYFDGRQLHNALADRILEFSREGYPVDNMIAFLENLMKNPSKTSVDELYLFLEATDLPITEDGCFLAYKKVRDNFTDIYSGKFDNSPGSEPSMPRNEVDDNRDRTCSKGLHFCSRSYLPHFGRGHADRVVIVKINPADVVSIPSDYNNAKGRAAKYQVIGEFTEYNNRETAFNSSYYNNNKIRDEFGEAIDKFRTHQDEEDLDVLFDSLDREDEDDINQEDDVYGFLERNDTLRSVDIYIDDVTGSTVKIKAIGETGESFSTDLTDEMVEIQDHLEYQASSMGVKARMRVLTE